MNARQPVSVALILARSENGVIGADGKLPWHISADLKNFKTLTVGKPVIMGRKTFDSIGKPLPRRTNIVMTRASGWSTDGVVAAGDIQTALALGYEDAHRTGVDEVMVIGGAEIYALSLPHANRIYVTEVHRSYDGDTGFNFDATPWQEVARARHAPDSVGGPEFSFVTLDRR